MEEHQWLVGEGAPHGALLQLCREGEGDVLPQTSSPGGSHSEQPGEVEGERGEELWVESHGSREEQFLQWQSRGHQSGCCEGGGGGKTFGLEAGGGR